MAIVMMSDTPKFSTSAPVKPPQRVKLFLRPTDDLGEGEEGYYRLRLLNFVNTEKNDRDYPFIVRNVHRVFGKNEEGKNVVKGEVVCPTTVFAHQSGKGEEICEICKFVGKKFDEYRKSNKTDVAARAAANQFKAKFEAWIPVYVINDPTYDRNNGKLMAFCFNDKKEFDEFRKKVEATRRQHEVYNGGAAVDFFIRLGTDETVYDEGTPNEHVFKKTVIRKMVFSRDPYPIPQITTESLMEFEFDDQLYTPPSKEEVKAFYDQFCKVQTVGGLPDDDEEIKEAEVRPALPPKASAPTQQAPAKAPPPVDDFDDLLMDEPPKAEPAKAVKAVKAEPAKAAPAASVAVDELEDLL